MYKEALIRNTYQHILANRPRDLTEEELEQIELEQQERLKRRGENEDASQAEGTEAAMTSEQQRQSPPPRESTMTPTDPSQLSRAYAPFSGGAKPPLTNNGLPTTTTSPLPHRAAMPLGLPPLANGCPSSRVSDSPMSRTTSTPKWKATTTTTTATAAAKNASAGSAIASPSSTANCSESAGGETSSLRGASISIGTPSLMGMTEGAEDTTKASGAGGKGVGSGANGITITEFLLNPTANALGKASDRTSTATLGGSGTSPLFLHSNEEMRTQCSAMSWVEDDEDEFYDQLENDVGATKSLSATPLKKPSVVNTAASYSHATGSSGRNTGSKPQNERRGGGGGGGGRRDGNNNGGSNKGFQQQQQQQRSLIQLAKPATAEEGTLLGTLPEESSTTTLATTTMEEREDSTVMTDPAQFITHGNSKGHKGGRVGKKRGGGGGGGGEWRESGGGGGGRGGNGRGGAAKRDGGGGNKQKEAPTQSGGRFDSLRR